MHFEQQKLALSQRLENRIIERKSKAECKVVFPTLFHALNGENGLYFKWSRNLTDDERKASLATVVLRKDGFSVDEWTALTKRFRQFL